VIDFTFEYLLRSIKISPSSSKPSTFFGLSHILLAPQVVQPVPQIENGEALIIPTKSDIDVFVSQKMSNQIWNLEYIDLTHLLYNNFVSNIDKPKKVLGFGEDGDIIFDYTFCVIQKHQYHSL
jgi:DNA-dependent RNA polymerase auxiliary subunit epsilon